MDLVFDLLRYLVIFVISSLKVLNDLRLTVDCALTLGRPPVSVSEGEGL